MPYQNYINLDDEELEKPVYRIMRVDRLLQCLAEKELVLVPPSKWDDPFENWLLSSKFRHKSTEGIGDMKGIGDKIYGQCWTQHEETDAMWRIYSEGKKGAKVKTTPKKLLEALFKALKALSTTDDPTYPELLCFIGKVEYQSEEKLATSLEAIEILDGNGSGIAKSLLYKREAFSHEKEVRLIYTDGSGRIYPFDIEPNLMFDEIVFDPRMDKDLFSDYKSAVEAHGFPKEKVTHSALYRSPSELLIEINDLGCPQSGF